MLSPHTITILSPTVTVDRKGARQGSWANPAQRTAAGFVQPRGSSEDHQPESERVTSTHALFTYDQNITAQDRIRFGGQDFLIIGEPSNHPDAQGVFHHAEASLQIVTG